MADDFGKIIYEKARIMQVDDLMREVRAIQEESYKKAIDYYAKQQANNAGKDLIGRAGPTAKSVVLFEKDLYEFIRKNRGYNSKINSYLRDFDQIEKLNKKLHRQLNGIDIETVLRIATGEKGKLTKDVATGIVGEIKKNLTGPNLRSAFTKQVQKTVYDNLLLGTPFSQARKIMSDAIRGSADKIGQLERWSGQITRDAINQYDGQINAMVAEEYGMDAYRYVGSIITDSRPQCVRWVNKKIIPTEELSKELSWARSNGQGMIPGTNVKNFAQYRGGYNCRHQAIPTVIEEQEDKDIKLVKEQATEKPITEKPITEKPIKEKPRFDQTANFKNDRELQEAKFKWSERDDFLKPPESTDEAFFQWGSYKFSDYKKEFASGKIKSRTPQLIDEAFKKFDGDHNGSQIFRGLSVFDDDNPAFVKYVKGLKKGDIIKDSTPMSFTKDINIAKGYAWGEGEIVPQKDLSVLIRAKKIRKQGFDISKISRHSEEAEVLVKPNTDLKIVNISKENFGLSGDFGDIETLIIDVEIP